MRSVALAVALTCLIAAACCAQGSYVSVWGAEDQSQQSTSSWYGNVGLIVTPSAYTPPASAATIGGHWVDRAPDATWVANVNFGLTRDLEIGGAWIEQPNADAEVVVNAKYHVDAAKLLGEANLPDMAVGVFDVADEINRSIYLVFSKSFRVDSSKPDGARINLHAGWGVAEQDGGPLDGFFGGVEFRALKDALVQAEFDGDAFNADIRYNVTPAVSVEVGVLDGDLGAGLTYRSQF